MGLIMGTSATSLYNNVRGADAADNAYDEDFSSTINITEIIPGLRSDAEISGEFSNSVTAAQQAVVVDYKSLVWKNSPYDKFVILEYKVKNPTSQPIVGFHFGIFADWDITTNGQQDAANWYDPEKLGYVYPAQTAAKPYAGIQVLTGPAGYYAIDNDNKIAGNPFGLYDGFTDTEKFTAISTQRLTAGMSTSDGDDVSHVVSSGPYTLAPNQVITLAFAIHAAANLNDLKTSAVYADSLYNYTLKAPLPLVDTVEVCYNSPATLTATGATKFKWYKTFTGGNSFFTGSQYTSASLTSDTTFYVSNADSSYESVRTPAAVVLKANPKITTSGSTTFCNGQSITLSVANADSYLWSTGETTQTIQVSTADVFSVTVRNNGLACQSTSSSVATTVNPNPQALFSITGDLYTSSPITFTDQSTDAVSWFWQFGDGGSSTDQNTSHTYSQINSFSVSLTVTSANGCQDVATKALSVITGLEDSNGIFIYPNPVHSGSFVFEITEKSGALVKLSLINMLSQSLFEDEFQTSGETITREIPANNLSEGVYVLKIKVGNRIITKKVVKAQ